MLLEGRRILVTGVLNDSSIAFGTAKLAQEHGAEVVLTSFGRVMSLTQRAAKRLPSTPEVVELDVTNLARDLGPRGIRVNLVCAGPIRTIAARSIPGFDQFEAVWDERAPLGWNIKDTEPVAKACVALLSDLFPATTGEMLHVDGGFHAIGA
jgi:enoyl-[acyl-carrier-protein] reductase (NADH)